MINEEKDLLSRKISKLCSDPRDIHPAFAVGPPQHRMIVCYDKFQQIPFGAGVEHLSLCLCSWDLCSCSRDLRCSWFMRFRIATWSCRHNLNLHSGEEVSKKKSSKCFNLNQPALQLPQINFSFFAMALNDVPGLLLPVAWHDLTQVISLQTSGSCGPAVSVSGRWPGPRAHREHTCITTSCRVTVWAEYRWQAESILDWYHVNHDQITSITITWNLKSGLQWVGLGHGQCDPPPLRPLPPRQASHIVCYSNVVWSYR